jgi:hypothetical protein
LSFTLGSPGASAETKNNADKAKREMERVFKSFFIVLKLTSFSAFFKNDAKKIHLPLQI